MRKSQLSAPFIIPATARSYRIPYVHVAAGLMLIVSTLSFVSCGAQSHHPQSQGIMGKVVAIKAPQQVLPPMRKDVVFIRGHVSDQETGKPLAGTNVTLYTLTEHFKGISDANGDYKN